MLCATRKNELNRRKEVRGQHPSSCPWRAMNPPICVSEDGSWERNMDHGSPNGGKVGITNLRIPLSFEPGLAWKWFSRNLASSSS